MSQFDHLDDQQLIEGLRTELSSVQLSEQQQAMLSEMARRTSHFTSLHQTVQTQATQLQSLATQFTQLQNSQQQAEKAAYDAQQQALQAQQTAQQQVQQARTQAQAVQPQLTQSSTATPSLKITKPGMFDGSPTELSNWTFSVELYFSATKLVDEKQQMNFAATLLKKSALTWYRQEVASKALVPGASTWNQLRRKLVKQFISPDHEFAIRKQLLEARQNKTVKAYTTYFTNLVLELGSEAPDEHTQALIYMNGLKKHIRDLVIIQRARRLQDVIQIAERVETSTKLAVNFNSRSTTNSNNHNHVNPSTSQDPVPMELGTTQRQLQCYYCGKYGHTANVCRTKLADKQAGKPLVYKIKNQNNKSINHTRSNNSKRSRSNTPNSTGGKKKLSIVTGSDTTDDKTDSSKN